ncbi:DUF2637 domain-containing protein [Sphaerisporangium sp. TRM90804]|uniref:DUF2637 domain-containing protein n=1 Tax=Sphaerisporangium sp. TRM90804 TaxID=3031113 RepID=UPI002447EF2D|nr:DUF2637 domain-containing protein [Sphaerisporangium sp. TRM90804]MDH2426991.1 DUF2637 domain-containing protein [Sphaerisporangium sp. TRM90804]
MDVTPSLAAGKSSRRHEPLSAPVEPTGAARVLRRAGTAVAALAVAALAGAACVLSFEPLRALAVVGGAQVRLAHLYPAAFDALLAIALIAVLLLRPGRRFVRLQAGFVLALLVAAAAAANVVAAVGIAVDMRQAAVAVAVLPWVLLVVGLWLLMLLARGNHAEWARTDAAEPAPERTRNDVVPFGGEERDPVLAPPLEPPHPSGADRDHGPGPEPHPHSRGHAVPDVVPAAEITPVVPPTAAPETPPVDELPPLPRPEGRDEPDRDEPEPARGSHAATGPASAEAGTPPDAGRREATQDAPEPPTVPQPRDRSAEAPRDPDVPLRWGDLVRPTSGDVLVHPLPSRVRDPEPADAAQAPEEPPGIEVDTQPYPHLRDEVAALSAAELEAGPDPAHHAELADEEEAPRAGRQPYGGESAAPPSGRMRSTPLPPGE